MDDEYESSLRTRWLNSPVVVFLCALLVISAALGSVFSFAQSNLTGAGAWTACATIGVLALIFRQTLPPLLGLFLTVAAVVNTAGYVLNLWHDRTIFDEFVHAFTTFAGLAAAGWLLLRQRPQADGKLIWIALGSGLILGLAWEAFEYVIGLIGDLTDTLVDLLMDMVGAAAAGSLLRWLPKPHVTRDARSQSMINAPGTL